PPTSRRRHQERGSVRAGALMPREPPDAELPNSVCPDAPKSGGIAGGPSEMSDAKINRRSLLALGGAAAGGALFPWSAGGGADALLAPTPPMGWNSWNSFATTITEAEALATAAIMRRKLLPFGYDVFTIDIQWYEPQAKSYAYNRDPVPAMD